MNSGRAISPPSSGSILIEVLEAYWSIGRWVRRRTYGPCALREEVTKAEPLAETAPIVLQVHRGLGILESSVNDETLMIVVSSQGVAELYLLGLDFDS